MPVNTIAVENGQVKMIDQTLLPTEYQIITIETVEAMWEAIKMLRVRGAPAIGVAAALGVYVGIKNSNAADFDSLWADVEKTCDYLASSRPTAVNLFWALDRVKVFVKKNASLPVGELKEKILGLGVEMIDEDNAVCRAIGKHGAELIKDGDGLLTHCNAGGLATASYGTALAPMFTAHEQGKKIKVFADETYSDGDRSGSAIDTHLGPLGIVPPNRARNVHNFWQFYSDSS